MNASDAAREEAVYAAGSVLLNGYRFDREAKELLDGSGKAVPLRAQCLGVLSRLASKPGHVVTKEELMQAVWPDVVVTDDSLVQCIGDLRRVLGDAQHRFVQTVHRRGYRLIPSRLSGVEPGVPESATIPSSHDAAPPQEVRYATCADGAKIAYACCGEGVPIVRGTMWISHLDYDLNCQIGFGPMVRVLVRGHRVIRYDRRGQGLSDRNVLPGSLDTAVADLKAVVDAAELSRFVLWGCEPSVPCAIRFAAFYPERVERLILSAGFVRGIMARGEAAWSAARSDATKTLIEEHWADENPQIRLMILTPSYPGATQAQMRSLDELLRNSCTTVAAMSSFRSLARVDVSADLSRIRCPTLVTHSRRELLTPFDEIRRMVAGIPDARLLTLDSDNVVPVPHEPAFGEMMSRMQEFIAEGQLARVAPAGVSSNKARQAS